MLVAIVIGATPSARAQTLTTLYAFTGLADGGNPHAGLVLDSEGNLYGTATTGGSGLFGCIDGCGVLFKVDPAGHETVLHSFGTTVTDGESPNSGLFRDRTGHLYGTTTYGGAGASGIIFRVSSTGKEQVLSFTGGANGGFPDAGLVPDSKGNLYGATLSRGTGCAPHGCGTVYKVSSAGKETVIHSFTGGSDGAEPNATLLRDSAGNLYGTTIQGGTSGLGTVFKVSSSGMETVIHSFTGSPDGAIPYSSLVLDGAGNLYGTTTEGGTVNEGSVFKIDPNGNESVFYSFCSQPGCTDGIIPVTGLVRDSAGNLYGTTLSGGANFAGTVFKLDPTGKETALYSFTGGSDGEVPYGTLVLDGAGNLYGTTSQSGDFVNGVSGFGTVFKVTP